MRSLPVIVLNKLGDSFGKFVVASFDPLLPLLCQPEAHFPLHVWHCKSIDRGIPHGPRNTLKSDVSDDICHVKVLLISLGKKFGEVFRSERPRPFLGRKT